MTTRNKSIVGVVILVITCFILGLSWWLWESHVEKVGASVEDELIRKHVLAKVDPQNGDDDIILTDIQYTCEENAKVAVRPRGESPRFGCWNVGNSIMIKYTDQNDRVYFKEYPLSSGIVNPGFRNKKMVVNSDFEARFAEAVNRNYYK